MATRVDNAIPIFTPIESTEYSCLQHLTFYLSPFGGRTAVHVPRLNREDGSKFAARSEYQPKWYVTALVLASYILSLGIMPLLAMIATFAIRYSHTFYWALPREWAEIEYPRLVAQMPPDLTPNQVLETVMRRTQALRESGNWGEAIHLAAVAVEHRRALDEAPAIGNPEDLD